MMQTKVEMGEAIETVPEEAQTLDLLERDLKQSILNMFK